jgi:hypothetical protein
MTSLIKAEIWLWEPELSVLLQLPCIITITRRGTRVSKSTTLMPTQWISQYLEDQCHQQQQVLQKLYRLFLLPVLSMMQLHLE